MLVLMLERAARMRPIGVGQSIGPLIDRGLREAREIAPIYWAHRSAGHVWEALFADYGRMWIEPVEIIE